MSFSELPTLKVITAMDLPSIPRPPGTPIPATPQSDEPPPFYPPADVSHLVPTDSRRSSVAFDSQRSSVAFDSRRSSVAFLDLYGTPPASPRFAPGPPRSDSPVAWDSAGAASSGGSSAAGGSSPAINPMRKPPFNFQPTLASKGPVQSKPVRPSYLLYPYLPILGTNPLLVATPWASVQTLFSQSSNISGAASSSAIITPCLSPCP